MFVTKSGCDMGMFDSITCELPLPDGAVPWRDKQDAFPHFQSKSMACTLSTYVLGIDRILRRQGGYHEVIPEEERQAMIKKSGITFAPMFNWVPTGLETYSYTGEIHFYGDVQTIRGDIEWHEYKMWVLNG